MRFLIITLLHVFVVFQAMGQTFYRWPSDFTGNPKIGFNYGVNEEAGIAFDFHQGIDIQCFSNQELIYAVDDGSIYLLQMNGSAAVNIFFRTTSGKIFIYGHCKQYLNGGPQLYTGVTPSSNTFTVNSSNPVYLSKGAIIGTTAIAVDAQVSYDHCHFVFYNCNSSNTALDEYTIRNPLSLNYVNSNGSPVFPSNVNDPQASPGSDPNPRLGPLRIMRKFNGASSQPNITYLNCLSEPFVYGEVDFTKEATDDLGYISNSTGGSDAFKWCNSTNPKTNGIRGVPYKIKYYLKNPLGVPLTGIGDPSPQGEYIFNGEPLLSTVATNKLFLYDGGSGESINSLSPPASYNFVLSNLYYNGTVGDIDDRYWNTKLKSTAISYTGSNADEISEAKYPDDIYKLHTEAEDIRGSASNVPQEDEILVDNFKPYVKNVKIYQDVVLLGSEKYIGEWIWNGSSLAMNHDDVNDRITGGISPSASSLQFVINFSEPMQSVTCGIPTMNQTALQTGVSNDKKQYIFSFSNTAVISIASGIHTLSIQGQDLAGNFLLGLTEPTLTSAISYTTMPLRDANGAWQDAVPKILSNNDRCHHFDIACTNGNRIAQRSSMTGSCMDADFDAPLAPTVGNQIEGDAPLTVTFSDLTAPNAASWFWDFGDGVTSTLQNPSHIYTMAGVFNVSLTAYSGSESDVETKIGYVKVNTPNAPFAVDFIPSASTIQQNAMVTFTNTCTGLVNPVYEWIIDDGHSFSSLNYSTANPPAVEFSTTPPLPQTFPVTLSVTDDNHTIPVSVTKQITIDDVVVPNTPLSVIVLSPVADNFNGRKFYFAASVTGGKPPYSCISWEVIYGGVSYPASGCYNPYYIFPNGVTSYDLKATYVDDANNLADGTLNYITLQAVTITFGSTPISGLSPLNYSQDYSCNKLCEFEVNYTYTPNAYFPFRYEWTFTNNTNPAANYSLTEFTTTVSGWFSQGNWTVQVDIMLYNTVVASQTDYFSNTCSATNNTYLTSFGFRNGTDPCYQPSDDILPGGHPNSLLVYTLNTTNLPGFSGLPPHALNTPSGGTTNYSILCCNAVSNTCADYKSPCFNNPLYNYMAPLSDYKELAVSGFYVYFELKILASSGTNPVTKTWELTLHYNTSDMNLLYYPTEKLQFTGTYFIGLSQSDLDLGGNRNICPGSSITLGGNPTNKSGKPPYYYTWNLGTMPGASLSDIHSANPVLFTSTLTPADNYSISLTVLDACGNSTSKSITVNVQPLLALAGNDASYCSTSSNQYLHGSASGGSGFYAYHWSQISGNTVTNITNTSVSSPQINILITGISEYQLMVTDLSGACPSSTENVIVTINNSAITADAGSDITGFCPGASVNLQGSFGNATVPANVSWEWHPFGKPANLLSQGTGTTVSALNLPSTPVEAAGFVFRVNDGGCYAEDIMYIFPDHSKGPQVNAGADLYSCQPGSNSFSLNGQVISLQTGTSMQNQDWLRYPSNTIMCSGFSTCSVTAPPGTNTYTYRVTASDGCMGTDQVVVAYNPISFYSNLEMYPCKGTTDALLKAGKSLIYPGLATPYTYEWSGPSINLLSPVNAINPVFTASNSAIFNVTVTDANGCSQSKANAVSAFTVVQTDPDIELDLLKSCVRDDPHYFNTLFNYDTGINIDFMGASGNPAIDGVTVNFASTPSINCIDCNENLSSSGSGSFGYSRYLEPGNANVTLTVSTACGTKIVNKNFTINPIHAVNEQTIFIDHNSGSFYNYIDDYYFEASTIIIGEGLGWPSLYQLIPPWTIETKAVEYIYFTEAEITGGCEFTADIIPCSYYDPAAKPVIKDTLIVSHDTPPINSKQVVPENESNQLTEVFKVSPNPTTGNVTINIGFQKEKEAVLFIEDQLGHLLDRINLGKFASTIYSFNMGKYGVENQGIYYLKLLADDKMQVKKLVLLK